MLDRKQQVIVTISFAVVLFFVAGNFITTRLDPATPFRPLTIFGEVVSYVSGDYVEDVDESKAIRGALGGFLEGLDSGCSYLDASLVASYPKISPLVAASPVLITKRYGYGYVMQVEPGSAAEAGGLKPGDYIRGIDRASTRDMSLYEIQAAVAGRPAVDLAVVRDNWRSEPVSIKLVNAAGAKSSPAATEIRGDVAIFKLYNLRSGAADALRKTLREMKLAGRTRLIVDLRHCGGMSYEEAVEMASSVIKEKELAHRAEQSQKKASYSAKAEAYVDSPRMAVLIDDHTHGAAELLASALKQSNARAFGGRTYGYTREQKLFKLSDGSGVLLSVYEWTGPDGAPITEKGIEPDVQLRADGGKPEADPVIEAAVSYLQAG